MSILEYNEEEEIKKIRASERSNGYDTAKGVHGENISFGQWDHI